MKVGIITAYPEPIGFNHGVLQFCKLAQASPCGIKPLIIAMTRHPEKVNPLVLEGRRLGLQVETLHERFPYDPRVFPGLVKLIKEHNIEILDAQTYKPLALALFARSMLQKRVPLVSWVHGFTQENLKIRMFNRMERYLHRFSDRVVCVSKPFAEVMAENGVERTKIEIVGNAVGAAEFSGDSRPGELREQLGLEPESVIVGAIGRLSPEKGHTFLIKAWRQIHQKVPCARLVIVGDGPCMKLLQQEVNDLSLQDSVIFTGFRPDGRRFFSIFDVMVLPSLAEGLPYVLLEAMIQGVPVIASSVGEVPEVLENGGVGCLVKERDSVALAKSVVNLLNNADARHDMVVKARASVLARYSHESRLQSIARVYKQVTEK